MRQSVSPLRSSIVFLSLFQILCVIQLKVPKLKAARKASTCTRQVIKSLKISACLLPGPVLKIRSHVLGSAAHAQRSRTRVETLCRSLLPA